MDATKVDYTIFFRRLSAIPGDVSSLKESFYRHSSEQLASRWEKWLQRWRAQITSRADTRATSKAMKRINPKFTWREWLVVPAYQQAEHSDFRLIKDFQGVFNSPYDEQSTEAARTYDRLMSEEFFHVGGASHYSCSS